MNDAELDALLLSVADALPIPGASSSEALEGSLVQWTTATLYALGQRPQLLAMTLARPDIRRGSLSAQGTRDFRNDTAFISARQRLKERLRLADVFFRDPSRDGSLTVTGGYVSDMPTAPLVTVAVGEPSADPVLATAGDLATIAYRGTIGEPITEFPVFEQSQRSTVEWMCWHSSPEGVSLLSDLVKLMLTIRWTDLKTLGVFEVSNIETSYVVPDEKMRATGRAQTNIPIVSAAVTWEWRSALLRNNVPGGPPNGGVPTRYTIGTPSPINPTGG